MIILDSSVWVAFQSEHDSQHEKALGIFPTLNFPVLLLDFIISEVCTALVRDPGKKTADQFLHEAEDDPRVRIVNVPLEHFHRIMHFFRSGEHIHLSFVDVALLYLSQEHTVITFDRALEKAIVKLRKG